SDPKSIAAEMILDDVLRVYPYLVTASIIVFDIDPSESGSPRMERVARELFSLDNVELASHSWAHPFDWRGSLNADKNFAAETFPGYPNRELLVDREVRQSVEFINQRLAPPGKSVKVFLWSGQANPDPRALQATGEAGVVNMNGGLGRFDSEFDSSSWLVPLVAQVDGQVQYYATNPNDHNYTGLWTGPFEGFKNVIQTFKRTESPRRLTPIDVYYHFYSGSKDASLSALHQVFDWIGTQEITSVWASDYVRMVQGWLATAIHPLKQDVWRISDYGDMRTVRFDDTDATVDIVESTNVVGHRRINGSLYVFLGAGGEATVHLADSESQSPHLEYCGCLVDQRTVVGDADVFSVDARLDTVFRFAGLTPGTGLTFTISGASTSVTADADGKASVRLPRGSDTVEVRGHIDQR
ncbi:MAG: hypothetical protein IH956_02885, partial [Chloroflexi bacterium]|nr:hypothetical protein [Chloroflexota bacterium]